MRAVWRPPPKLTINQWAETYGVLTAETSAEPGRWRSYGYQVAMLDAFCQTPVERVTIMKSARIGYTKILGHVIGYYIHQDPAPILIVQPTEGDAEGYSKEEIQPIISEVPELLERVGDPKSRTTGNTITKKHYPGGILHLVGANAARGFRRITVRLCLFDECDGYPPTAGQEGDQIKLGIKRTETYYNRKIALGSTPTNKGMSRIDASWEQSDKGYFVLSCPDCGGDHIRLFRPPENPLEIRGEEMAVSYIQWVDDNPRSAAWICPDCGTLIGQNSHHSMIEAGRWVGERWEWRKSTGFTFDPEFDGHIGFRIWAGYSYSPNSTPEKLVAEFLDSKDDWDTLKTFVNTVLGEPWEEKGESANEILLKARARGWGDKIPAAVLVLTAGVDIQADRIELEIIGWGESEESWSIDYIILPGDTTQPDVWADLGDTLRLRWPHASGASMSLAGVGIDSSFIPATVYAFCKKMRAKWIWPLRGRAGEHWPVVENMAARIRRMLKRKAKRIRPELVGVDEAKLIIMRRLKLAEPGPGFCHFPSDREKEYFAQLTGEQRVMRKVNGRLVPAWVKTRARNEALDCRVYGYAALKLAAPDFESLKKTLGAGSASTRRTRRKPRPKQKPRGTIIR